MFGTNGVGHMSIIENWIQSESENEQQLVSNEKMLQMEARMNKVGVLGNNNNNGCHVTKHIEIRELVSKQTNKTLLDRTDMDHKSIDLTETVAVQEKVLRAIQEPNGSNIYTAADDNNELDDQTVSLAEDDKNDELPKSPQMETHNTPTLNGPDFEFLKNNTTSEVDHLLDDDVAAANLYLEFMRSSQPNASKSSTNLMQNPPCLSGSPRSLLEKEVIPSQEQNHIADEVVNERSVEEYHDTANEDSYFCENLQNSPASVSGIFRNKQVHLVYNSVDHPHSEYQSETTEFSEVQSHNQYSTIQVAGDGGDGGDYIAVDNELPMVPHGSTPLTNNGKEIPSSHKSVENQRNAEQEQVNTSGTASTPGNLHQSAASQAQANNAPNNETDRLAMENMNLYQYSMELYKYLLFSELFKSQMIYFICQTINGTNNLSQLYTVSRDISTNQQSDNQNSSPQTQESTSRSLVSNNQRHNVACQAESVYSGGDQIEERNDNITTKKSTNKIGRKGLDVGVLKPGIQNTTKCRKRVQALTAISKSKRVKKFKNKENRHKDEYTIENLDNPSPEQNWFDASPRKIDFGPSTAESYRTPKRLSKYMRNKQN